MIKPMLATAMHKGEVANWTEWSMEEKFDGHRLLVRVTDDTVKAFTRPRKHSDGSPKQLERPLGETMQMDFGSLPNGIYDGELIGGDTSTDVVRLDLLADLKFVLFDVIELDGKSTTSLTYLQRRELLEKAFSVIVPNAGTVLLADAQRCQSKANLEKFVRKIWDRGGEGAIIKKHDSKYIPKRSPEWIKVKKQQSAVMEVVGFEPTRGEVLDRGPHAIVILQDAEGNRTTVKTLNDVELDIFNREANSAYAKKHGTHPSIGRKLRIEFQDRTRDGGYRHPRWDRWEKE